MPLYLALLNNISKKLQQTTNIDGIFRMIFAGVLKAKAYLFCFTQVTVDLPKLTVNGSVLSDTPNVRYLVALFTVYTWLYVQPIVIDKLAIVVLGIFYNNALRPVLSY